MYRYVTFHANPADSLTRPPSYFFIIEKIQVHALPSHAQGASRNITPACVYSALYNLLDYAAGTVPVTAMDAARDAVWAHDAAARNVRGGRLDASVEIPIRRAYQRTVETGVAFPVGVQLVGRPYSEELVLRVMRELEASTARASA